MHRLRDSSNHSRARWRDFAVRGIFWRTSLDWAITNVPFYLHPFLIFFWTSFFFLFAAPARKAVVRHLSVILPGSSRLVNYFRAFRTFYNFGWSLADAAAFRLLKSPFAYELTGANVLQQLMAAKGAIVLTAHMGNYDLGAALFADEFQRKIRMVRAPEPDELTARHVDHSLEQSSAGGVQVDYSTAGTSLSFDLLAALREGQIISIQGDRVVGDVGRSAVTLFGKQVFLPTGPFVLSLVAEVPIYPLFIVRTRYRQYGIIAREPITCSRTEGAREQQIASAMNSWCRVLEQNITKHWDQWYAFTPIF